MRLIRFLQAGDFFAPEPHIDASRLEQQILSHSSDLKDISLLHRMLDKKSPENLGAITITTFVLIKIIK